MTLRMNFLTVSEARAGFSGIAREVIRSKQPVIVRVPHGIVQIAPYFISDEVRSAPRGSVRRLAREKALGNRLGDSF